MSALGESLLIFGPITIVVGLVALGMLLFCCWDDAPRARRHATNNAVGFDATRAKQNVRDGIVQERSDDC